MTSPSRAWSTSSDFMKSGASATTGSSRPLKRTCTAPAFTPARSSTSFRRTQCVSHSAVRPLRARNTGLEIAARIAGALIDGNQLHVRQREDLIKGERQAFLDMTTDRQTEGTHIDLGGDDRPMPADVELVVRCQDRLVEHFERGFQQRRARTLEDERPLVGKARGDRPLIRPARQRELDYR